MPLSHEHASETVCVVPSAGLLDLGGSHEYSFGMNIREMRPPTFYVLLALTDGVKHGYAILADAERLSSGRVRLQVGSLYAVIDRLTEQGWIRVTDELIVRGRVRRYLELTDAGRFALEAETNRLEQDAKVARTRLRPVTD